MDINDYLSKFEVILPAESEIYDEQKHMALEMITSLETLGTVIVCQGPTGMGKSIVIDAVAWKLGDEGHRVLISTPVYSNLIDNHYKPFKQVGINPGILHGWTWWIRKKHKCPKDGISFPNKRLCIEGKCEEETCDVYKEYQEIRRKNIVLTVHHKIAASPAIIKNENFDILIVDESHTLPQIIENMAIDNKTCDELQVIFESAGTIPRQIQRIINNAKTKGNIKKIEEKRVFRFVKQIGTKLEASDELRRLARSVRCEFIKGNWYFYTPPRRRPKFSENLSVALVSATIESPPDHIKDCRYDSLSQAPPFQLPFTERFRKRFKYRPVYYLADGPILRKDPDSFEIYMGLRQEANELIHDILLVVNDQVTIVLCRANDDALSIKSYVEQDVRLANQLVYLGDEDERETDEIEKFLEEKISGGKKIIIATAKNGLWEGGNIPELRCVIIDSLPYRAPSPIEKPLKSRGGFQRSRMFRFMINRLQQGIGRLVRRDGEWGIAIIIDGRMYSGKRMIHKQLPEWISSPKIMRFETKTSIVRSVELIKEKLIQGEPGTTRYDLDDFDLN